MNLLVELFICQVLDGFLASSQDKENVCRWQSIVESQNSLRLLRPYLLIPTWFDLEYLQSLNELHEDELHPIVELAEYDFIVGFYIVLNVLSHLC